MACVEARPVQDLLEKIARATFCRKGSLHSDKQVVIPYLYQRRNRTSARTSKSCRTGGLNPIESLKILAIPALVVIERGYLPISILVLKGVDAESLTPTPETTSTTLPQLGDLMEFVCFYQGCRISFYQARTRLTPPGVPSVRQPRPTWPRQAGMQCI